MNYKEATDKAFQLHSLNMLDEAEILYKDLLEVAPEDVNVLNLYGMLSISKGNFDKAISLLSKAVVLKESSYIITNLAKAYMYANQNDKAIKLLEKAIQDNPDDDMYYSLAIAYKIKNDIDKAINAYNNAIELNPNNYNALYNLAILYQKKGSRKEAINCANHCLIIKPNSEEIFALLSTLYEADNNINYAIKSLEKAAAVNPNQYLYFYNLGVLYSKEDNFEKSVFNYKKALSLCPDNTETLVNLCSLYKDTNKDIAFEYIKRAYEISDSDKNVVLNLAQLHRDMFRNKESIEILKNYIENNPDCDEAYSILGTDYMDLGEYKKALESYKKAIEINPNEPNYKHALSMSYKYLGKTEKAKQILEEVVNSNPDLIQSSVSLGMFYLNEKNFEKGMELYIKRSLDTKFSKLFKQKVWDRGIELKSKNVLVYTDCGLGDTLMYARYLPSLAKIAESVVVQTDTEIVKLISDSFKDIKVINKLTQYSEYDIVIPIMNLPYALNIDFNNIPLSVGYLKDDDDLTRRFTDFDIFKTDKIKVGIVREGNRKIFKNRSVPKKFIELITENENCTFYLFQKNGENIKNTVNLSEYMKDYSDTASLLKNTDVLITVDSSIVHAAGGLGVKTFLMLPYTAEWRWFNDTKTTPWYNSVKIFKQPKISDWQSVTDDIIRELNLLCKKAKKHKSQ